MLLSNSTKPPRTPIYYTASLVLLSFVISIFLSIFGFFIFEYFTGYLSNAGFAALVLVLFIPLYIVIFAVPLTLLIYVFIRKLKFGDKGKKVIGIIAFVVGLLIFGLPAGGYVFDRWVYLYTPQYKNKSQLQLYKKLESEQYTREDYKTKQIVVRDENVWLTYSDEANNFSFKYMPIWHYKKENLPNDEYKLTFYYNDLMEKIGTKNSEGTDVLTVELFSDAEEYFSMKRSYEGVATDKNEISILKLNGTVYAKLTNGKSLKFSRNNYNWRQYNSEYNNRIVSALSTTIRSFDQ